MTSTDDRGLAARRVQAVILAAGEGRRMRPLTERVPKPMITIDGRPFLERLLANVRACGIAPRDIVVVVGHLKEIIIEYLQRTQPEVRTVHQQTLDGTAGALHDATAVLDRDRPLLMLMGDNYYDRADLRHLLAARHHALGAIRSTEPEKYGVLETDERSGLSVLRRIIEKPRNYTFAEYVLVSAGCHFFQPEVYAELARFVGDRRRSGAVGEIPLTDVIGELAMRSTVEIREFRYWQDMGSPEDIPRMETWLQAREGG